MNSKLSIEQVLRVADLARIGLTQEEKIKLQEGLGLVIAYIEKLGKVDVSSIAPTAHASGLENQFSVDEYKSSDCGAESLFGMAPDKKDGYIKVKQVLNR